MSNRRKGMRGVTLIELMVVVAVIGILSAIAIPAYGNYRIRVNRTDAKRDLMALASQLERCFTRGNDYTIEAAGSDEDCVDLPQTNAEGTYRVDGVITANTYTLTATPLAGQTRDAKCARFTLNQAGVQGVTGTATAAACWDGRDG